MSYEACDLCGRNITNDDQFYLCRECWDKEHLKSPDLTTPPTDELERLIENIRLWDSTPGLDHYPAEMLVAGIKLLAERVRGLEGALLNGKTNIPIQVVNDTPQARNPLTREEIIHIRFGLLIGEPPRDNCNLCNSIKSKLTSYLEA